MSRPIINLDVDGVLTNGFADLVIGLMRSAGVEYPGKGWDLLAFAPPSLRREIVQRLRRRYVAANFKPRAGAMKFVNRLREWAQVRFVTSPFDGSPTWAFERESWLVHHVGARIDEVVHARDKSTVNGHALLDDRVANLRAFGAANPGALTILWDAYDSELWYGYDVTTFEHAERLLVNNLRVP